VYGGGGVMPDYFIPLDTTIYTKYHRELAAKSVIINANLRFAEKNRKSLIKKYGKEATTDNGEKTPGFIAFEKEYEVPQSFINDIFAEGEKQGVKPKDDAEKAQTIKTLRRNLKALIARDLWSINEYFRIYNEESEFIKCALKKIDEN
jgi:carboxyl-terminal processing protease